MDILIYITKKDTLKKWKDTKKQKAKTISFDDIFEKKNENDFFIVHFNKKRYYKKRLLTN